MTAPTEPTNRQKRRQLKAYARETSYMGRGDTRSRRRYRREARKHAARMLRSGMPERAAIWLRRARNG